MLRPLKVKQQTCGVAYVNGSFGSTMVASKAYAVVSDGKDGVYFCPNLTLAHELGHNMGASHNIENASGIKGVFPYSYGYGMKGMYGDIMSYYTPQIPKFSNPAILATTVGSTKYYLGVEDVADVVKTFQQTAPIIANFATKK